MPAATLSCSFNAHCRASFLIFFRIGRSCIGASWSKEVPGMSEGSGTAASLAVTAAPANDRAGAGILQVMFAAFLWATVGVATQLSAAPNALPHEMLGAARTAIGGPAILLALLLTARLSLSRVRQLNIKWLACLAISCAVFQVCLFDSFVSLGVTLTVFITVCLPPVIGAGLTVLAGHRSLGAGTFSALALAIIGLVLVTIGEMTEAVGTSSGRGVVTPVIASLAFLLMTHSARKLTTAAGPLLVAGAGLSLAAVVLLVMLTLLGIDTSVRGILADLQLAGLVIYLGLGPTALAYVFYCSGMARCRTLHTGLVASMVEPAFAAFLAWLLLKEQLPAAGAIGCLCVMAAMLVLYASERRSHRGSGDVGTSQSAT
jgi:DME family drug/metabolite transporter